MTEKQLPLSEEFSEEEKDFVPVQERTFRIYKPFIRCATCVRNIDLEKMKRGFFTKTFCNYYKESRQDQFAADYDILKDRQKAQHCLFYLPEIGTLADLTYIKPYEIVNNFVKIDKQHAKELNNLFQYKGEN